MTPRTRQVQPEDATSNALAGQLRDGLKCSQKGPFVTI